MLMGIDVGPYTNDIDWELLREKGILFAIIKATQGDYRTDPLFRKKVAGALNSGLMVGLYHWVDPLRSAQKQADYFLQQTEGVNYHFAATDIEQEWSDWSEWPNQITKFLSPQLISDVGKDVTSRIRSGSGRNTLVYTRVSFMVDYARPMLEWVKNWPLWLAAWPYRSGRISCSWEFFKANYLPIVQAPQLPAGSSTWYMWQFSGDKFVLPGLGGMPVDLDYFNGSEEALRTLGGIKEQQQPEPLTLEERVTRLEDLAGEHGWF
jgi:GH25 family lysozyme M1 (1,4-beta-N-acetylmuramidase)